MVSVWWRCTKMESFHLREEELANSTLSPLCTFSSSLIQERQIYTCPVYDAAEGEKYGEREKYISFYDGSGKNLSHCLPLV